MSPRTILVSVIGMIAIFGIGAWIASSPQDQGGELGPAVDVNVTPSDRILGNEEAPVTLIEYGDFQCPACRSYYFLLEEVKKEFPDELRIVYRHFPLTRIHPNAMRAAVAAEAAGEQGKFSQMHDLLFERQPDWSGSSNPSEIFLSYAQELELDTEKFKSDMEERSLREKVEGDMRSGRSLQVNSTPTFFLQGQRIQNPRSPEEFIALVRAELVKAEISEREAQKTHIHADMLFLVKGEPLDFSRERYQSTEEKHLDEAVHLHDGRGDIIHVHRKGVTIGYFLETLGISREGDCLALDTGEELCNGQEGELNVLVNGTLLEDPFEYELQDEDRILLSYGQSSEDELASQMQHVGDEACIYSGTCPERGEPPEEASCTGEECAEPVSP